MVLDVVGGPYQGETGVVSASVAWWKYLPHHACNFVFSRMTTIVRYTVDAGPRYFVTGLEFFSHSRAPRFTPKACFGLRSLDLRGEITHYALVTNPPPPYRL
jgi:hypothetical protein